jgi:hypothetical protein
MIKLGQHYSEATYMSDMTTDRLPPQAASRYLADTYGIANSVDTLARGRCVGTGPEFIRIGRAIRYSRTALDAYARRITSPLMRSTHEPAMAEAAAA